MTSDVPTQEALPFGEAFRRMWVHYPSATVRYTFFAVVPTVLLLPIHLTLFARNDTPASLLAVPLLPLGGYLLLWGRTYQRTAWRLGGLLSLAVGSMLPFYVT